MEQIVVRPNGPLHGTVRAGGAKNSALKLMVACLLAEGRTVLRNVPLIDDVESMAEVLRAVGAQVERLGNGDLAVTTPAAEDLHPVAPYELVERMRASVVVLGLLLARCGEVHMPLPGGDDFGDRPIDFHVNGLTAMGARFEISHGEVRGHVEGGRLVGTKVVLEYPSHTATDNLLMAAVLAKGTTVIENAAKEPEIIDLAAMLGAMGAVVRGAGHLADRDRGGRRAAPHPPRRGARPGGGRHLRGRGRHDRGRRDDRRRPAGPHGDAAAQGQPDGRRDRPWGPRGSGSRRAAAWWRPTWPRCPTPAWPPTSARCWWPC